MDDTEQGLPCRACGAPRTKSITITNFFLPEKDPALWTDGFCSDCGSVSHFSRPLTSVITYHDSAYRDSGHAVVPPVSLPWSTVTFERHRHISEILSPYLQQLTRQAERPLQHLDYGGYNGFMSFGLKQVFDLDSTVADLDPRGLAIAVALNMNVIDLTTSILPDNSFDVVTAVQVVEHIEDPLSSLRSILESMIPTGGVLYCEVPNVLKFPTRDPAHYSAFSPRGLHDLFARSGFDILEMGFCTTPSVATAFTWPYFSPKEIIYLIGTNLGSTFTSQQNDTRKYIDKVLADSDSLDYSAFQRHLHSSGARLGLRNSTYYAARGAKAVLVNLVKALISLLLLIVPVTGIRNCITRVFTRSKRLAAMRSS